MPPKKVEVEASGLLHPFSSTLFDRLKFHLLPSIGFQTHRAKGTFVTSPTIFSQESVLKHVGNFMDVFFNKRKKQCLEWSYWTNIHTPGNKHFAPARKLPQKETNHLPLPSIFRCKLLTVRSVSFREGTYIYICILFGHCNSFDWRLIGIQIFLNQNE